MSLTMKEPRFALGALALAASLFAAPAGAVGTRTFQLDSLDDFKGGDLAGVSVDSSGHLRAGLSLGSLPLGDATTVWSAVELPSGAVLLGTGSDGKVIRVDNGRSEVAATTGQMAVSSMAIAWDGDVILGTFPEGKLYKIAPGATGGAAALFATLPDTEDIWGLAFDAKAKALYAATGPEGKLYRIDAAGKAQVQFDSDDPHLMSVAVADDGSVYTGSSGKALLYKVTGPGRASVVYDFDADEVRAIAFGKAGQVYAVANKYTEAFVPPKKNKAGPPGPQAVKSPRAGKGLLMRFSKDGVAETMLDDDDTHYVSLAIGDDGQPYVGTGVEGRLYTVDDNHVERLVADTPEQKIGAVVMAGKRRFLAGSDPAVFHEVKGTGGADAVWTSKTLDAGLRATWGRLAWRSEGAVELSARSGNTVVPDATWTAWSAGLNAPGPLKVTEARYVQLRGRWNRDPAAVLREVTLSFVTDNARAIVTSIDASQKGTSKSLRTGVVASGGEAPRPSSTVKVTWKVDNPDQDELRYRLSYRLEGQSTWRSALKPGEKLTRTDYDWETSGLPEGLYRLMIEASDELANPPDRATHHSLESGIVLVDNTPPTFKTLAIAGRKLTGEVNDGVGPIARIEVSIAGSDEWRPVFPADGIFDEKDERIDANLGAYIPAGSHLIVVRAYDAAGNQVTRDVEAK
jgi:hypothetical protein